MTKPLAILSLSFALVLAGFRLHLFPEPPSYSRLIKDPAELARQAKYLDDLIRARGCFVAIQDGILKSLAQGKLSLPQACDQLYQCARVHYPQYLRFLKAAVNITLKEKMARHLVAQF